MLMGLDGSDKMSKSNPDSAIFMDDSAQEVKRKIRKAFCEPSNIKINPILEYFKTIVFQIENVQTDPIKVPKYEGGSKQNTTLYPYKKFEDLEYAFETGFHYPNELKDALEGYLNYYLKPVREYFASNPEAAKLSAEVKRYTDKLKAKPDTD
jgi:tyrosyl-tRNA synthetase